MTAEDLKKLSKEELEALGRTKGVELDRRLTKSKLVKQLTSLFTSSNSSEAAIRAQIAEEHPTWSTRLITMEFLKRQKEENK
tara:strand:- start:361 stop:606 length:246 start_codon:yes stop_codon:yes gene_type:complete